MKIRNQLLTRLDKIALAVKESDRGLALLGLGSVGQELDRLDAYSDLDFFVIAKPGQKHFFLDSLSWLERVQPVTYSFRNTADGHKFLFADGIFCETAVFEPAELANIPYTGVRVVWQDEKSDLSFALSNNLPPVPEQPPTVEWLVGEILSNLYVGLGRFRRGEMLAAARFIQGHAVDRILELAPFIEDGGESEPDPFDPARRFEQRFPKTAVELPKFLPGYEQTPQAARAILSFLERLVHIDENIKEAIISL